jgi:hypothetical protein
MGCGSSAEASTPEEVRETHTNVLYIVDITAVVVLKAASANNRLLIVAYQLKYPGENFKLQILSAAY